MSTPNLPPRLSSLSIMFLLLFALALQGCGSSESPVVDASPAGYYTNIGIASVDDGAGGTISVNDLQGIVNDDGVMMMMSTANKLLYDGTITNISGNDFTAEFIIFTDGENPMTATARGTITEGSKIEGTLIGSGAGSGTFSLLNGTNNETEDISNTINELQKMLDDARK